MEIFSNNIVPWINIWTRPRETIRKIVSINPEYQVTLLAILTGIAGGLAQASDKGFGDNISLPLLLVMVAVFGPIGGLLTVYIGGVLFRWTGSWFGGRATTMQVRAVVAWSSVPRIVTLILWPLLFVIYGNEVFTSEAPVTAARVASSPALSSFFTVFLAGVTIMEMIVLLWGLFIFISGLSEVHRFSVWRAIAAAVIPVLALLLPAMCFAVLTG